MKRLLTPAITLLACLAPCAAAHAERVYTGRLEIRHADDFVHAQGTTSYDLVGRGGRRLALSPARAPRIVSGSRVVVRGSRRGHRVRGDIRATGAQVHAAATTGPHKVAVLLFNFNGDTRRPWTTDQVRSSVFTASDSANAFYREESYGDVSLTGKVRSDGDVYGWYTISASRSSCDVDTWATQARAAAAAAGVDLTGYDHIVYAFPMQSSCWWAGLGELPGRQLWVNGDVSTRVVAHELGHNMGLHHASSYSCTENGAHVAIGGSCTASEYGDPFDVMGSYPHHAGAWHLAQLGYVSGSNIQTVTSSGTYTVTSAATRSSAVELLRIPRPALPGQSYGEYYDLELRTGSGVFDNFSSTSAVVNGVTIHVDPATSVVTQSLLLDTTPGSSGGFNDAALAPGRTFSDGSTSVTTDSIAGSTATVSIVIGAQPPASTPPPAPAPTPPPISPPPPPPPPPPGGSTGGGNPPPTDSTPPKVSVAARVAAARAHRSVAVRASALDSSGVRRLQLVVDGRTRATSTRSSAAWTIRGLSTGRHTIVVRAYDAAGNVGVRSTRIRVGR